MEKVKKRGDGDGAKKSKTAPAPAPLLEGGGVDSEALSHTEGEIEGRKQIYQADSSLQFICDQNGLTEKQFSSECSGINTIEVFQAKLQSVASLEHFHQLETLNLISTAMELDGVNKLLHLRQLCIIECGITSINGLRHAVSLTNLNASSNNIQEIGDNLKNLTNLETLWINDNKIKEVTGLATLGRLKTLWLARNLIESFGTCFDKNTALRELNLADNRIGCFREVLNLNRLPALRVLSFTDPHYGDNPVCALCNYQTYVMYQLNQLISLDTTNISEESKQLAEATYMKKKCTTTCELRPSNGTRPIF
jgi:Leucine-rich repeat (LRR) protein